MKIEIRLKNSSFSIDLYGRLKGNMHHKHYVSSKDAFYVTDIAAGIYF